MLGALAGPAVAGDWHVDAAANCASADGSADAPWCTLGEALAVAVDGDVIHVAPGTYVENVVIAADVTVLGSAGRDLTVIDGNRAGTVIEVASGRSVVLDGLTVRNGLAAHGAGIHVLAGATLDLLRSTLCEHRIDPATSTPDHGAAICVEQATLRAEECLIWSNDAWAQGAGIWGDQSTLEVTRCSIDSNFAGSVPNVLLPFCRGGGICCLAGSLTITDSILSNNTTGFPGYYGSWGAGGSVMADASDVVVERCEFRGGFASVNGGGLAAYDCTLAIADSNFTRNLASLGGGFYATGTGTKTIDRCRSVLNVAGDYSYWGDGFGAGAFLKGTVVVTDSEFADNFGLEAGGLYVSGAATLLRCRIVGNRVEEYDTAGGGIVCSGTTTIDQCLVTGNRLVGNYYRCHGGGIAVHGNLTLRHSTIAGNSVERINGVASGSGGGIDVDARYQVDLDHVVIAGNRGGTNDVDGTVNSLGHNCIGDTAGATITGDPTGNQLDVDPLFANAAAGDFSLSAASPCIDSGDPALAPTGTDVAGNPRWLDGDLDRVQVVDLGALEFGHVHLGVTGSATPGGTLTFATTGTAGLAASLFVGIQSAELAFPPFGPLFIDVGQVWLLLPWGAIPSSVDVDVPSSFPVPITLFVQPLAFDSATRAGNFGNLAAIAIE